MDIFSIVVINIVLAMVLVSSIFTGKRNGWKLELGKLIFTLGAGVSSYFIQPTLTTLLDKIKFLDILSLEVLSSLSYLLVFFIQFAIICIVINIIRKNVNEIRIKGINRAKVKRAKGINRREERKLKREERKLHKQQLKDNKIHKASSIIGAILGFIIGIVLGAVIMLPVKNICNSLETDNFKATKMYEYTIYGQFDKVVDLNEVVIKGDK